MILHNHLHISHVCSQWIQCLLMPKQKQSALKYVNYVQMHSCGRSPQIRQWSLLSPSTTTWYTLIRVQEKPSSMYSTTSQDSSSSWRITYPKSNQTLSENGNYTTAMCVCCVQNSTIPHKKKSSTVTGLQYRSCSQQFLPLLHCKKKIWKESIFWMEWLLWRLSRWFSSIWWKEAFRMYS